MRDEVEYNLNYIDFNPNTFSYLLIQSDVPINREQLKNRAKKVISMLVVLILNPLYLEEFYHFIYEKGSFSLSEASFKPFEKLDLTKKRNHLHGRLKVNSFNKIAGKLFNKISKNPISESLYSIIMEYIASYREPLIEIRGTTAWNVLEHIASRYWRKKDKKKLYIVKEEKFNQYIKYLKIKADQYIKYNIDKEDDVTLDLLDYKNNYKSFLKNPITRDIIRFSPVKFRIYRMFEEENILYESKKELIKDMYSIRNKIFHDGLNLEEIQKKIRKNPNEIIVKFRPFLYQKILEFLGFIDEFFFFDSGHLIIRKETKDIPDILKGKLEIITELKEFKLVQKINDLADLMEKIIGLKFNTEVVNEEKHYKVSAVIIKENGEYIIKFLNPPQIFFSAFDKIPSKEQKYPEEITRYLRIINCTFRHENFRYDIEFYNKPLDYPFFDLQINHPEIEKYIEEQIGRQRKIKEKTSRIDFKIRKVNLFKI